MLVNLAAIPKYSATHFHLYEDRRRETSASCIHILMTFHCTEWVFSGGISTSPVNVINFQFIILFFGDEWVLNSNDNRFESYDGRLLVVTHICMESSMNGGSVVV